MYQRVLLKLSGEALSNESEHSIFNPSTFDGIAKEIKVLRDNNIAVGVVIGGGNIWRGKLSNELGIEEAQGHYMGMLGTVINAVAMCNVCRKYGVNAKVFSALHEIPGVCELYSVEGANKALNDGYVCFYAAGTGKPFFSTDTGATMRAVETHCDAILMAKYGTKGVYDSDPNKNPNAKFFKTLSYQEVIDMKLGVMDLSAVELVKDSNLELRVFSMSETENIHKVTQGEDIGTTIRR